MTGPPWVSEEFFMAGAYEQLGVLRVIAGLSRHIPPARGRFFADSFVVTHIFAAFHLSRRKNGKNAAKTEDSGLNT